MGIAGPVFGTVAALVCYAWFYQTGSDLAAVLAYFGMFINLWNLLPVPPLDGGGATAAVSPWLWGVGLAGMVAYIGKHVWTLYRSPAGVDWVWVLIIFWIMSQSLARVRQTLLEGAWRNAYYRVGWRTRLAVAVVYFGLAALLLKCTADLSEATGLRLW